MSQSPSQRRNLSPEPSHNATPQAARYPSFASPTRSQISRAAPQILQRRSMENDAPIQRRSALARTPPGAQPNPPIQRPSALTRTPPDARLNLPVPQSTPGTPSAEEQEAFTPSRTLRRSPRSNTAVRGGLAGLAAAPRRPSQSPQEQIAQPAPRQDIFDEPPPDPDLNAPVDLGIENPFQKRSALRRSFPPGAPQPVVAASPPMVSQTTNSPSAFPVPNVDSSILPGDAAPPMPPPSAPTAPTAATVAASDGRAALRNQRLRGAQTRSPGQVDFGFNIPSAPPRPAAPAPSPLSAPPEAVAAVTRIAPSPAISAPFVDNSEPTPTPPTRPQPLVAESPLFVSQSQNTDSPAALPNIDSSILSTRTPTPALIAQRPTSRAVENEAAQPEGGRHTAQRRSDAADPEEPQLPPTPTQRGIADPVVTSPRTGIHNTPSKRLKRRQVHQSSPLKPRNPRPEMEHRSEPIDEDTETGGIEPQSKRQRAEVPLRFEKPVDPNREKKRQRDRMLAEIRQLEADIKLAEQENERVRKATAAGNDLKRPANADAIVKMLSRTTAKPPSYEEPKQKPTVLDNIGLFLPFARQIKPKALSTEDILKTEHLPSVLPVEVKNPLPFLSAFTPFKFGSTITTLPPTPSHEKGEADILQVHSINTTAPHLLFSSRVSVTVNTRNGAVDRIDVEYLDPAAESELEPWIRKRAQGGVLGRDVNSIAWASQQWYESALKRARFWGHIELDLSTQADRDKARRRLRQEARRGRKSQLGVAQEPEEHFDDEDTTKYTPDQLRRNMGRQSMELEIDGVKLTIYWKIEFDWTGEAQQAITASVKAPRRWHEMDERKQLDRVPEIFKGLVKERSPTVAARTCVVLLMGE